MFYKTKKIFILIISFFTAVGFNNLSLKKDYPIPEGINHLLFYVQRTSNTNTLVYALNLDEKNEINTKNPIKIYWINYALDGGTEPLNYVQKKYAYGIETEIVDIEKKSFRFKFVSYKKKELYLIKTASDNKYHVFYNVKDKLLPIVRVFIKTEGGLLWPKVKYTDITCIDLIKNEEVVERIIP